MSRSFIVAFIARTRSGTCNKRKKKKKVKKISTTLQQQLSICMKKKEAEN